MFYLSEVLNSAVKDSSEMIVGRLKDILIKPITGSYDPAVFLLVENKKTKKEIFIPLEYVANLGKNSVTLKHLIARIPEVIPAGGEVYLQKEILDEQIVDVKGARVVRVNDLKLGPLDNVMCVLGIDVSFRGILRRLGLEWLDVFGILKINLIDWREAQLMKGSLKLNTESEQLKRLHPADLANIIEELSIKQGSSLVDSMESDKAAQVVEEMEPGIQKMIMQYLGPERAADIVEKMSADETVDLLQSLPEEDAKGFLDRLQNDKSKKIATLFKYDEDMAGGIMTTDYAAVDPEWTVKKTVEEIKNASPNLHSILYVYVVDKDGNFRGVVSMRTLLISKPTEVMRQIMKSPAENTILKVDQKVDEIIRVMTKYNLYSAGVVDENGKMAGVVTLDDIMRFVAPDA